MRGTNINPYNVLRAQGVANGKVTALPQNYASELTMDTWWSAVLRARLYSDFTGLDALYSYAMKSSTWIRSAVDKRLRPLKARTFSVMINGKENEDLTKKLAESPLMRKLIYQKGLSNFTYARVVGVNKDLSTFVYPLRNLDTVNKKIKKQTYDIKGDINVESHVNLFWFQTDYDSEDTLGLLEPVCRDYINILSSQNNWQTASQYLAYQQLMMYFENGDDDMVKAAQTAAAKVGLGQVIISGQTTDEITGKKIRDIELENVYGNASADTFRIYKENIEQLRGSIMQLIIGSSLLGMSEKNTNSERLVRAHLKMFRDICEEDAVSVQDWFNSGNVMQKLAYLLNEPKLANATMRVKPQGYIDIGDVEIFIGMLKDLGLKPTEEFIRKAGLAETDVIIPEEDENNAQPIDGREAIPSVPPKGATKKSIANVAMECARRLFQRGEPSDR